MWKKRWEKVGMLIFRSGEQSNQQSPSKLTEEVSREQRVGSGGFAIFVLMENPLLSKYMQQFRSLRRARQMGGAPHKPVLLLSVAQLFREGIIQTNRIHITDELFVSFTENWKRFVNTSHTLNVALPFFHLGSEPFWQLIPHVGKTLELNRSKSISSLRKLLEICDYAAIDPELFELLTVPLTNALLVENLLDTYFPHTKHNRLTELPVSTELPNAMLITDPAMLWQQPIQKRKQEQAEQERYVRSALFREYVRKVYDFRCAISGMQVRTSSGAHLIEACHIQPFSASETEDITNGIALTPTLHRAFDKGFITIDTDYRVLVSPLIHEEEDAQWKLQEFEGKPIALPTSPHHYPALEKLAWHRDTRFLQ